MTKLKCNPGNYQCGRVCIGSHRKCRKEVREEARKAAMELKALIEQAGLDKTQVRKQFKLTGKDTTSFANQLKEQINKATTPKGNSFTEKWKESWANIPAEAKAILESLPPPNEVTDTDKPSAFYRSREKAISMGVGSPDSARDRATFRHEAGHYVDDMLGREHFEKIIGPKRNALTNELKRQLPDYPGTIEDFLNEVSGLASDKSKADQWWKMKQIRENIFKTFGEINWPTYRSWVDNQLEHGSYLSGSKRFNDAMRSDEKSLLSDNPKITLVGFAEKTEELNRRRKVAHEKLMNDNGITDPDTIANHLMDFQIFGPTDPIGNDFNLKDLEIMRDLNISLGRVVARQLGETFLEIYDSIEDSDNKASLGDKLNGGIYAPTVNEARAYLLGYLGDDTTQGLDLVGSITLNEIGEGHSSRYYTWPGNKSNQNAETFAQVWSLYTKGNPLIERGLSELVPETFKIFKEELNK